MRRKSKIQQPRARQPINRDKSVPLTKYYRSGDSTETPSPFKSSRKTSRYRSFFIRGLDILIIFLLLFGLVFSMLVNFDPKLVVSSYAYRPYNTYYQPIVGQLRSFKNRNKITLDEAGIAAVLKAKFPEISGVSLELPLLSQKAAIHLTIAAPAFLISSGGQLFLIDSEGRAVSANVNSVGFKDLAVITDQSGFSVVTGKQVLSSENVAFINTVLAQCKRGGVSVQSLTLPAKAQDLYLKTADRPYYTKFFLDGDVNLQSGQFLASRHQFDVHGDQPSEYLDVRVPGKIFYK